MRVWLKAFTTGECRYKLLPEQVPPGWKLDAESGDWHREVQSLEELVSVLDPLAEGQRLTVDVIGERRNKGRVELELAVEY